VTANQPIGLQRLLLYDVTMKGETVVWYQKKIQEWAQKVTRTKRTSITTWHNAATQHPKLNDLVLRLLGKIEMTALTLIVKSNIKSVLPDLSDMDVDALAGVAMDMILS
jgi:hypothetical protein